jgi:hypothetical protein
MQKGDTNDASLREIYYNSPEILSEIISTGGVGEKLIQYYVLGPIHYICRESIRLRPDMESRTQDPPTELVASFAIDDLCTSGFRLTSTVTRE